VGRGRGQAEARGWAGGLWSGGPGIDRGGGVGRVGLFPFSSILFFLLSRLFLLYRFRYIFIYVCVCVFVHFRTYPNNLNVMADKNCASA
jgi:hypothetical protein